MARYLITCNRVEYLQTQEIEADSPEQAEEEFYARWTDGDVIVTNSEMEITEIKEIK